MFSRTLRVTNVLVSAWFGNTALRAGWSNTSSNVSPSGMLSGIIVGVYFQDSNGAFQSRPKMKKAEALSTGLRPRIERVSELTGWKPRSILLLRQELDRSARRRRMPPDR